MKALIIYDDVDCAERAIEFLRRAASQAGMHGQWEIKPWRVSVLRLPTAAGEALLEAVGADAIVFADLRGPRLPNWLNDWLKRWGVRRQPGEPALVVTCANPTIKPRGISNEVSRFAAQNDLELIVQTKLSVGINRLAFPFVPPEGESLVPATLDQEPISLPVPHYGSYRNWGINE
jgi:hypothetical protein